MLTDGLRTWAVVDYDAIAHNVQEVRKLVGTTKIMGIVKANAYGHGAVACALALQQAGVDFFAVACLSEALELRAGGIEDSILILGYTPEAAFAQLLEQDLIQTAVSLDYARKLAAFGRAAGQDVRVHVKLDTGMNRTGIVMQAQDEHFDELLALYQLEGIHPEGLFSHYPVSDELNDESVAFTNQQTALFVKAVRQLRALGIDPGLLHIQNSYGILNYGDLGMDYCRPGLLYMGVTSDDAVPIASQPDFIPILRLYTKVSMVKDLQPGETVSYGRHYTARAPMRLASICIGYADGLPRAVSNKGLEVLIRGQRAPIVGNVCMDQCMVDVTHIPDVQEGDVVTVIGRDGSEQVTVDAISRAAGTINNETLTRLTSRVDRFSAAQAMRDMNFCEGVEFSAI